MNKTKIAHNVYYVKGANIKMTKERKYFISWNNYPSNLKLEELKEKIINYAKVEYMILSFEVGEKEHTPHVQGYVRFKNPQHFNTFHKLFQNEDGTLGYIKRADGNDKQNQKYCSKQNNYIEYGKPKDNEQEYNEESTQLIEDILDNMPFIEICKKYSNYVTKHYKDFRQLYNDLKFYKKEQELMENAKKIEELLK